MNKRLRKFKLLGGNGSVKNGFFSVMATVVTEDYDSKIPLIASRRISEDEDYQDIKSKCSVDEEFPDPKDWVISQYRHKFPMERVGISNFKLVRMDVFNKLWKTPIAAKTCNFKSDKHSLYYYLAGQDEKLGWDHHFMLEWDHDKGLDWLYKHDVIVYPFTDDDRMFADPGDELAYIADVLNSRG